MAAESHDALGQFIDAALQAKQLRAENLSLKQSEKTLTRLLACAVHALGPIRWAAPFEDMPEHLTLRYTHGEIDVIRTDGSSVSKPPIACAPVAVP